MHRVGKPQHSRVCLHLHLAFLLEFSLGKVSHGTTSYSLLKPSGARSESMGAGLCWTPWLKEEATLWLVGKSKTVLTREAWGSTGST